MVHSILRVENLVKRFGSLVAVNDLTLDVNEGEILGFLGPNGAGKTTAISMMCGLVGPDAGRVLVHGKPLADDPERARCSIGVCPQKLVIWEKLTCLEQMVFLGRMYNMSRRMAVQRAEQLLNAVGLADKTGKQARTLSGGMQRRLNLVLALMHDPPIVILDEPEAGLDPQSRVLVREFIQSLAQHKTVILTTHNMDEAERLAQRVAIMDQGRLLVVDTPAGLKQRAGHGDVLEIQVAHGAVDSLKTLMPRIQGVIPSATQRECMVCVGGSDVLAHLPDVVAVLRSGGIPVEDLRIRKRTLEDVFISLTGRGLRE